MTLDVIDLAASRHAAVDAAFLSPVQETFAVSDLVRLECSVHAIRANDVARLSDLAAFFASVAILPMEPSVFDRAALLRASHRSLKTPDALHLAIALGNRCDEFWTSDRDLVKIPVALAFRGF